jgi:hypothetical protein
VERTELLDDQPTRPRDTIVFNRSDGGTAKLPELEQVLQSIAEDVFRGWQPR